MISAPRNKTLNVFSLVMINIIAVDSLRTLPITAEYGLSLVFFYILAAAVYFIPVALVSAELATAWPKTGGLYVWVREAFGPRLGTLTLWFLWIYNVVWFPTILTFICSAIAYLFHPSLANNKIFIFSSITVIFWLTTFLNALGMRVSSAISTLGALLGTLLPMSIIIILALFWVSLGKPTELSFSWKHIWPTSFKPSHLSMLTGLLFGLVGMEMSAVHAGDVNNPQKDYPKALFYSTIIIFSSLVLSALAVALVVPKSKLSVVTGLFDAFSVFFKAFHLPMLIPIMIGLVILGGVCGVSTWVIGPAKGLMVAASDGCLPKFLEKQNRYGMPQNLLIVQAVVFTVLSALFVFFDSISASYWLLSALTAQLAMLTYVMMFLSAIMLRIKKPSIPRPFKVPGGLYTFIGIGIIGLVTCLFALVIGFVPPDGLNIKHPHLYSIMLVVGLLLFSLTPLFLMKKNKD